jgi:hypothetical protein
MNYPPTTNDDCINDNGIIGSDSGKNDSDSNGNNGSDDNDNNGTADNGNTCNGTRDNGNIGSDDIGNNGNDAAVNVNTGATDAADNGSAAVNGAIAADMPTHPSSSVKEEANAPVNAKKRQTDSGTPVSRPKLVRCYTNGTQ